LFWDCADHWQSAGQPDRATFAAVACARHLHDMGLVDEAVKRCQTALQTCHSIASKATVLRVMAHSQYVAHDWRSFCETVRGVRSLEGDPAMLSPIHDDLELFHLNAQRSLHRDWNGVLAATLQCVQSPIADAAHRVKAAIIALKIGTNLGAMEAMDTAYVEAATLAQSSGVSVIDRLCFTMIYNAIRGDPHVSARAARELLSVAERTLAPMHRLVAMVDCASALRRCGADGESGAVYETVFATAVSLGCYDQVADACHWLIELYLDAGRTDLADQCVKRYRALHRPAAELQQQRHLRLAIARMYLRQSKWQLASDLIDGPDDDALWCDQVAMLRSSALAVKIRLEIGRRTARRELAGWVAMLAALNASLRLAGVQDYETYSLYLGYCRMGEPVVAAGLLRHYVAHERRDITPVAPEIMDELAKLGATPAMPDEAAELPGYAEATDVTNT
jgi:hypothetical protein